MLNPNDLVLDYSALSVFRTCPRKFYFQYVKGLGSKHTPEPLVRGGAIHKALATWYTEGNSERAIQSALKEIQERGEPEDQAKLMESVPEALRGYFKVYPTESFKVLHVEVPLAAKLGPFWYIGEADAVIEMSGAVLGKETKTRATIPSGWIKMYEMDSQQVGYNWLLRKNGIAARGVLLDIVRMTKYPEYVRHAYFYDDRHLKAWEDETLQQIRIIESNLHRMADGEDPYIIWFKNTDNCYEWNRACQFMDVDLNPELRDQMYSFFHQRSAEREQGILQRALARRKELHLDE